MNSENIIKSFKALSQSIDDIKNKINHQQYIDKEYLQDLLNEIEIFDVLITDTEIKLQQYMENLISEFNNSNADVDENTTESDSDKNSIDNNDNENTDIKVIMTENGYKIIGD